jgi:hypothetical protein
MALRDSDFREAVASFMEKVRDGLRGNEAEHVEARRRPSGYAGHASLSTAWLRHA